MASRLTLDMIDDLTAGAAFLGTGGGGDPYIGGLLCREAIARHGPVSVVRVEELDPDALIVCVAAIGAPTVLIEKLFSVDDADNAVLRLEALLGAPAQALIAAEIGGMNSTLPIAYAARRGLPIVDGDGIGRAFPNLHMTTFNIAGVNAAPLTLASEHGETVVIEAAGAERCEALARPLVAALGASAAMAGYHMRASTARRAVVHGSLTSALEIGRAINDTRSDIAPVRRLLAALGAQRAYRHARVLFEGKIADVSRRTVDGWAFGHCEVAALRGEVSVVVEFQNENLVVRRDGRVLAIAPDLITVVDTESGRAIPTESLRYGQRVSVVGCSAPDALRTPEALAVVGPHAFRLSDPYTPIEQLERI